MKICLSSQVADELLPRIAALVPDAEVVMLANDGTFSADPEEVDVFCFSVDLSTQAETLTAAWQLLNSPSLRWVQAPGAGVELPIWSELVDRGVRLTTAAGVHAEPVAQYVFTQVLFWHRHVARHRRLQLERRWEPVVSDDLTTKTLGIVGMGGIGLACARIAKAFGMDVIGLRRQPGSVDSLGNGTVGSGTVDRLLGPDRLPELLADSDYVVLCLPLTDVTRNLFGAPEFDTMRDDAVLINVARGGVVDHDALLVALTSGDIAGASLDVTEPEPLPVSSPLWSLENCVITAHDAGYSPLAGQRLGQLFVENLAAYVGGEPLRNEVTPRS